MNPDQRWWARFWLGRCRIHSITVSSQLIPVWKDQRDDRNYSRTSNTWCLIQMPTLEEFCLNSTEGLRTAFTWEKHSPLTWDIWTQGLGQSWRKESAEWWSHLDLYLATKRSHPMVRCCLKPTLSLCFSHLNFFHHSFLHQIVTENLLCLGRLDSPAK